MFAFGRTQVFQIQKRMNQALKAMVLHWCAARLQFFGIGSAFVTQGIETGGDNQRGRVLCAGVAIEAGYRAIVVAMLEIMGELPAHARGGQQIIFAKSLYRRLAHTEIDTGVNQNLCRHRQTGIALRLLRHR